MSEHKRGLRDRTKKRNFDSDVNNSLLRMKTSININMQEYTR